MKKFVHILLFSVLLTLAFAPVVIHAQSEGLVTNCGGAGEPECNAATFQSALLKIFNIIVNNVAVPLAVIAIIIGAVAMITSAGNPTTASWGKKVIISAIIGLILALSTRAIIRFILEAIGSKQFYGF